MKAIITLVLILTLAQNVCAQWLPSTPARFDRGRSEHAQPVLSTPFIPQEAPHWLFPNVNISSDGVVAQAEPSVAIDPTDPTKLITGYIDNSIATTLPVARSEDAVRWSRQLIPQESPWVDYLQAEATDPSVAFDSRGLAYYLCGWQDVNTPAQITQNDLVLFRSSDHGQTWSWAGTPFEDTTHGFSADAQADKYYLGVDHSASSPYRDNLRAVWAEYAKDDPMSRVDSRIVFSASSDSGASWSKEKYLSKSGYYTSPISSTAPDGTIFVTYAQYWDTLAIWVTSSTDGGNTFSAPTIVSMYKVIGPITPNDSTGYQIIGSGSNLIMVNSFPSVAVLETGDHKGRVFINWCAKGDDGKPHVFLSSSDDKGLSWSTPRPVETDSIPNAYSRFFSWIAADPVTGNIGVEYYVVPMGPENMTADQYLAHSTDGGNTFVARRITSASSVLNVQLWKRSPVGSGYTLWFYGDYINLAGYNNTWHPVWTDARTGTDQEIYTATVQPFAPMPVRDLTAQSDAANVTKVSWQYTPETTFGYPFDTAYRFLVQKNNGAVDTVTSSTLSWIDAASDTTAMYKVWVEYRGQRSIVDSVSRLKQFVVDANEENIRLTVSRQPATQRRPVTLQVSTLNPSDLSISLYDEIGRQIATPIHDGRSPEHRVIYTPEESGVFYYVIRGETASGQWQRSGRLVVLPNE